MRRFSLLLVLFVVTPLLLASFSPPAIAQDDDDGGDGHTSLDLAINGYGIGFGNSAWFRGLRFNWQDEDVESVIGVNITFWKPEESPDGQIYTIQMNSIKNYLIPIY